MPFNTSGVYTRLRGNDAWKGDAQAGTKIRADLHDDSDTDLANGLTECLTKTGKSLPTVDIPWNGKKITGLGDGVGPQDAATLKQVEAIRSFATSITISGNNSEGRLNFTGTGAVGISYTAADLFFGVKQTADRWVWNDKADATGADVVTFAETGAISTVSTVTAGGAVTAAQNFASSTATVVLGTTGAGSVYLRPNGVGSAAGQVGLSAAGVLSAPTVSATTVTASSSATLGTYVAANEVISLGGTLRSNGPGVVLASHNTGNVRLRPNGASSSVGEAFLNSTGHFVVHYLDAASPGTVIQGNLQNKNGEAGGFGGSNCSFFWDGAGVLLWVDNSNLGRITTASDYRIKKDVADLPSTWDAVKALHPIQYTQAEFDPPLSAERAAVATRSSQPLFQANNTPQWGFIAHELQETLLPSAADGEKDMIDGVQSLNWAPVVAALTRALQEAMARIEALEAGA